jgi:hypothetical protein
MAQLPWLDLGRIWSDVNGGCRISIGTLRETSLRRGLTNTLEHYQIWFCWDVG